MRPVVCLAAASLGVVSAGSLEVRGADANVQMHNTFLKVWSQADVTPSFSAVMGESSMTHGLPLTHTVKLSNISPTCAGVWGETPCVPFDEPADYPKMFYCAWTDSDSGILTTTTGPYSPTLRTIKDSDGTVLAREARLACDGPVDGLRNEHHSQRLRVYFGDEGSDQRVELTYVGRKGFDRIGVIATAAPTMAPTNAPTHAPTLSPTNAPTPPTPAPTPEYCEHTAEYSDGGWSAHESGAMSNCRGDCDSDNHCAGDLVCAQRDSTEGVPGCTGGGAQNGMDYCYDPRNDNCKNKEALYGSDWSRHNSGSINNCEGDCDEDHHCAEGLVCVQREGHEAIKGCTGTGEHGMDYCARP